MLALLLACSTVHGVRPLGAGTVAVEGSLGGPVTELFGAPVPLPLTTVGVAYGLTDRVDVHGALHPSALGLFGIGMFDVGASAVILPQDGARPRISGDLTLVTGFGDVAPDIGQDGGLRLFAQPTVIAAWDWGKDAEHTVYVAPTAFVQPFPGVSAHGALAAGGRFGLGNVGLTTELKWIDPWADTEILAPNYYVNVGAVSFQLGLDARFGGSP